jgi:large subunit ribosomal protein L29
MKSREIRELLPEERQAKLEELRKELMKERGIAAMGGSPPSPGKIRWLRQNMARLLTIMKEEGEIE